MITPVFYNPIQQQPAFRGKTFSKKIFHELEDCFEKNLKNGKSKIKDMSSLYLPQEPATNICLIKRAFGFSTEDSLLLKKFTEKIIPSNGLSTEHGGYGGCWLTGKITTPLSTKDVHTCAVLNLVDEISGKQFLYHVHHDTVPETIISLIQKQFPHFNKVNIIAGDLYKTNKTVNRILESVNELNPKVKPVFYHAPVENPEIVAYKGALSYIENSKPEMSFKEVSNQYVY